MKIKIKNDLSGSTVERLASTMRPIKKYIQVVEASEKKNLIITRKGVGLIKTPYGEFWHYDFSVNDEWFKYSVLFKGDVDDQFNPLIPETQIPVPVRVHSGCETGLIFYDQTCMCREHLKKSMQEIARMDEGFIFQIPRLEGTGQGLPFKLAALLLQHYLSMTSIEATLALADGKDIDVRTYAGVIGILKFFGIEKNTHPVIKSSWQHLKAERAYKD